MSEFRTDVITENKDVEKTKKIIESVYRYYFNSIDLDIFSNELYDLRPAILSDELLLDDNFVPPYFLNKAFFRVDIEEGRTLGTGYTRDIFVPIIKDLTERLKDILIEIDSGVVDIRDYYVDYHYVKNFDIFVEATILQRWGYDIRNKPYIKCEIIEFIKEYGYLKEDGSLFFENLTKIWKVNGKDHNFLLRIIDKIKDHGIKRQKVEMDRY